MKENLKGNKKKFQFTKAINNKSKQFIFIEHLEKNK